MEFNNQDTSTLIEILRWRRDVRHFKPDPLPECAIDEMITAMAMAPSVGNSRPWRVVRVDSEAIRQGIIDNHSKANVDAAKLYEGQEQESYKALKLAGLREAPLQIAVFSDMDPDNGKGLGRQTMPETLAYSTIIAIHQLWLVARTLNIGVGWVSIINSDEINHTLDVDPQWKLIAYLCIGYPKTEESLPELHRKEWQKNDEAEWLIR